MVLPKKRVLFLIDHLGFGGAQMHLIGLLNGFSDALEPQLIIIGEDASLSGKITGNIPISRIKRAWRFDLRPAKRVAEYIDQYGIHAVVSASLFCFFFVALARLIKRGWKIKNYIIFHWTISRSSWAHFLARVYFLFLHQEDTLISTCDAQARYLSDSYHLPYTRFKTIYNGIAPQFHTIAPKSFDVTEHRNRLQIPSDAPVILQVATYRKEKAQDISIHALKYLHSTSDLKPFLIFVGGGDDKIGAALRDLSAKFALDEFIKFVPSTQDLRPYYWISQLFTLSSISVETFSIAALEAMSSGLPCVLTDIGGAREMVRDGINGYVVAPGSPSALASGWKDVLQGRLSASGPEIRKDATTRFSLSRCVEAYESLLRNDIDRVEAGQCS